MIPFKAGDTVIYVGYSEDTKPRPRLGIEAENDDAFHDGLVIGSEYKVLDVVGGAKDYLRLENTIIKQMHWYAGFVKKEAKTKTKKEPKIPDTSPKKLKQHFKNINKILGDLNANS